MIPFRAFSQLLIFLASFKVLLKRQYSKHGIKKVIKNGVVYWFNRNFAVMQCNQFSFSIKPKTPQGCLLLLLLVFTLSGLSIFIAFKLYPILFSTVMNRLGIPPKSRMPLIIMLMFGVAIDLPLYIVSEYRGRGYYEFLPVWFLKWWWMSDRTPLIPCSYIGLNVSGALIPIVLALYQFHRTQPLAILIVTAIVALISYFFVTVLPGRKIGFRFPRFWIVTLVAALAAMGLVTGGVDRLDVPVAFAGGVLGTTLGADLLHLKDIQAEKAIGRLSIGGAGLDDGIVRCGLFALIIAEWLPVVGKLFTFN